jgi:hypothetical protein
MRKRERIERSACDCFADQNTHCDSPAKASWACASPISPHVQTPLAASRLRQAKGLVLSTLAQAELWLVG